MHVSKFHFYCVMALFQITNLSGPIITRYLSLDDEGGERHGYTTLLLVSDRCAHSCDVLFADDGVASLGPLLLLQDLQHALLELGEGGAHRDHDVLLGGLRCCVSSCLPFAKLP